MSDERANMHAWKALAVSAAAELDHIKDRIEEWRQQMVQYLKDTNCEVPAIDNSGDNLAWAAVMFGRMTVQDERLQEQRVEIERLRQWVADLQSGMYINCVYCGHRYGPDPVTPTSMADVLKAHVEVCPKHPMSALKAEVESLKKQLDATQKQLDATNLGWV